MNFLCIDFAMFSLFVLLNSKFTANPREKSRENKNSYSEKKNDEIVCPKISQQGSKTIVSV